MNVKGLDYTCLTLSYILTPFIVYLYSFLFGDMSWLSRIIYTLVGLSGLYLISTYGRICQVDDAR